MARSGRAARMRDAFRALPLKNDKKRGGGTARPVKSELKSCAFPRNGRPYGLKRKRRFKLKLLRMEYGVARVRRGFPCGNRPPEIGKTLFRYSCKSPLSCAIIMRIVRALQCENAAV